VAAETGVELTTEVRMVGFEDWVEGVGHRDGTGGAAS